MEEVILRFPHLSERIFNLLNNKDLTKCRKVGRRWQVYLDMQKLLDIRIIVAKIEKYHEVGYEWKRLFEKANSEAMETFAKPDKAEKECYRICQMGKKSSKV